MALVILASMGVGLFLDQTIDFWGQTLTNIWVWILFFILLKKREGQRLSLLLCLVYATGGEIFLSLVWGLYEYRLHNLPLFVPPGHVLLFTLGIITAKKLPAWIIVVVPFAFFPYVILMWITGLDTQGGWLFCLFLACLFFGKEKKLYATMFMLALVLEVYGTGLGNWTWSHEVPWLALTSTNPPACAGAFYCLLDLLVMSTIRLFEPVAACPPENRLA